MYRITKLQNSANIINYAFIHFVQPLVLHNISKKLFIIPEYKTAAIFFRLILELCTHLIATTRRLRLYIFNTIELMQFVRPAFSQTGDRESCVAGYKKLNIECFVLRLYPFGDPPVCLLCSVLQSKQVDRFQ